MKATEMLEKQHREVATLFRKALNSDQPEEKSKLSEEIVAKLTLHVSSEEEIFYPAFRGRSPSTVKAWRRCCDGPEVRN